MGVKLQRYFQLAEQKAGLQGRMRVSIKTGIPSVKAHEVPDSEENIRKIKRAIREVVNNLEPETLSDRWFTY